MVEVNNAAELIAAEMIDQRFEVRSCLAPTQTHWMRPGMGGSAPVRWAFGGHVTPMQWARQVCDERDKDSRFMATLQRVFDGSSPIIIFCDTKRG